ncbi:MAG: YccF domain-containing protein [Gaiellaceae bacterium]
MFGGLWLALEYGIAAILLALTIVGLPFAKQSLKLGDYALWPFGRTLIPAETRSVGLSVLGNTLWLVLAGWWIALSHLISGALLCLTIIGIPLGVGSFKMAGAALAPFGKQIVPTKDLRYVRG